MLTRFRERLKKKGRDCCGFFHILKSPLMLGLLITLPGIGLASDNMKGPYSHRITYKQQAERQTSLTQLVLKTTIRFYAEVISPADGPRSPSYPTGSAYGLQAVSAYGVFPGILLIADRLLHEADINLGPTITIYGRKRYYDPLAYNVFWWDESVLTRKVDNTSSH